MENRKRKAENNQAHLAGQITTDFDFSHKVGEETLYRATMKVPRLSHRDDLIPVIFPEHVLKNKEVLRGQNIRVEGEFRSRQTYEDGHSRLHLFVMVKNVYPSNGYFDYNMNDVYLEGFLCRKPVFRVTPLGKEICDMVIAIKRPHKKSFHIPCIVWGHNARTASDMCVGSPIRVWGRIQSRDYTKLCGADEYLLKTAYEVSVNHMKVDMNDVYPLQAVGEQKVRYKRGKKHENHTGKRHK